MSIVAAPPRKTVRAIKQYREQLREGKHVFILDNSESACEMAKDILEPFFPGRVDYMTDSQAAVDEIERRMDSGVLDVLVLDLDMPKSGRKVALELANDGYFPPIVILSGSQGAREYTAFMDQIGSAENTPEFKHVVSNLLEKTGGPALTKVGKMDAVSNPQFVVNACDSVLEAMKEGSTNPELLGQTLRMPTPALSSVRQAELEPFYNDLSDELVPWVRKHHEFVKRLQEFSETHEPAEGKADEMNEKLEGIRTKFNILGLMDYDAEELKKVEVGEDWDHFRHGIFGNRNLNKIFSLLEGWEKCFDGDAREAANELKMKYAEASFAFRDNFEAIEKDMHEYAGANSTDIGERVAGWKKRQNITVLVDVSGSLRIRAPRGRIESALESCLDNSSQELEGKDGGEITVDLGKKKVSDLPEDVAHHFTEHGYELEEEVNVILISDNGSGFSPEVLEAWQQGGQIPSTKGELGRIGYGLEIMRRSAQQVNSGTVRIESSPQGTTTTFYMGIEPKEE
ncbi:MAG: ATP-binding protein [Methanobacteriota archaeon]